VPGRDRLQFTPLRRAGHKTDEGNSAQLDFLFPDDEE
jgi:hypothetical protein